MTDLNIQAQIQDLVRKIYAHLRAEFALIYVSGNLRDTIKVSKTETGYIIDIPAEMYNKRIWKKEGVIVHLNNGKSYANEVDLKGGYSGKHVDFVETAINRSIKSFVIEQMIKGNEIKVTNL